MVDRVTIHAHAKANLFLRVLAREPSGYHSIETLFTLLELHDVLEVERSAAGIELAVAGADTGPAEQNLAVRAAGMVLDATGGRFGVRLTLTKRIPVRAGLGGGSSDGAAALHAVNRLAGEPLPHHEILQFAARLGSDVTFFASGAPLAIAWGRGERLFRLPAPQASPTLLAIPPVGISTTAAYAMLDAAQPQTVRRGSVVLDHGAFDSWGGIGRLGGNDFENPVFTRHPEIRELFEHMAETQPLLVRLSGSGSALVAVYKNEREREEAAMEIGETKHRLIRSMTRQSPAPGAE